MVIALGVLRLELDKETYERAGLQGQPCRGGGRKHVKARYSTMPIPSLMMSRLLKT